MSQNFLNTIWMGDLEDYMDESFVKRAFESMGEAITSVKVIRSKTSQQPLGYCFVEFPNALSARDCMLRLNGKNIPGTNPVNKSKFKLNNASYGRDTMGGNDFSLFVGELTDDVDDLALYRAFCKYPSCRSAKVVTDGGRSRGYGFVRFGSESDQKKALTEMQNYYGLGYRAIRVSLATPKRPEDSIGGPGPTSGATSLFSITPDTPTIAEPLVAAVAAAVSGNSVKQAEYYQLYHQYYQQYYGSQMYNMLAPAAPTLPGPGSALNEAAQYAFQQPVQNVVDHHMESIEKQRPDLLVDPSENWKNIEKAMLSGYDLFQIMEMTKWDVFDDTYSQLIDNC